MYLSRQSHTQEPARNLSYIGDKEGPLIPGTGYRAYWKTHPLIMALFAFSIRKRIDRKRIETHKQVLIRVHPDEPNPLAGVTDLVV